MVYKSLKSLTPTYLSSKFIQRSDMVTSYNLRNSGNKLAIPLPRSNYYKNREVQSLGTVYLHLSGKLHL